MVNAHFLGFYFFLSAFLMAVIAPESGELFEVMKFSLGFTLDQLFLPFRGGGELEQVKEVAGLKHVWDYRLLYRLIGAVQSIGSLSLIALFILALRRRFKMD